MGEGVPAVTTALFEVAPQAELASPGKRTDAERIKVRSRRVIPLRRHRLTRIVATPEVRYGTPTWTTSHYLRGDLLAAHYGQAHR